MGVHGQGWAGHVPCLMSGLKNERATKPCPAHRSPNHFQAGQGGLPSPNSDILGSCFSSYSAILYAVVYHILSDILQNYAAYGFQNASSSCCWLAGRFGGLIPCGPTSKVCADRSKHVFRDPYHPSQATNEIIARRLLDGDLPDISPINLSRFASSS
ncbi:GDSL esterase/lipase At4g16230-like [Neltuma alba]|uniref:GDSL esterase/lipase At4g16230-like n=1 Tax=Neltuma alba TaxID=207710 RepID=UPI0010A39D4A|nr:GDSL esterase/lipase At4g16230-like [Prosopis alba]